MKRSWELPDISSTWAERMESFVKDDMEICSNSWYTWYALLRFERKLASPEDAPTGKIPTTTLEVIKHAR
jgi:hypothetical protein